LPLPGDSSVVEVMGWCWTLLVGESVRVVGAVLVAVMVAARGRGKWRKGHNKHEKKKGRCEHKLLLGYDHSRRFKKINNK